MSRPLCPHCFRPACPWLVMWVVRTIDKASEPPAEVCPLHDQPLAPNVRKMLAAALDR